jgi:hypothetical protein
MSVHLEGGIRESLPTPDKDVRADIGIPLRLFDCFGFIKPLTTLAVFGVCFVAEVLRFCVVVVGRGGSFADWMTGEVRKAVGDGTVIVSIMIASITESWTSVPITKLLLSTEGVHVNRKIYIDISWCAESVVVVVAEKGCVAIAAGIGPDR